LYEQTSNDLWSSSRHRYPQWGSQAHHPWHLGTVEPLSPGQQLNLRVYLAGQHPAGLAAAALAFATPHTAGYARYLTPAEYRQWTATKEHSTELLSLFDWCSSLRAVIGPATVTEVFSARLNRSRGA
jgi:hypothetical protein